MKKKIDIAHGFILAILLIITAMTLYIFWYCLVGAFSAGDDFTKGNVWLFPRVFSLSNFTTVLTDSGIYPAFFVTAMRTLVGTAGTMLFTSVVAYGMTKRNLKFRGVYSTMMIVCMFFSGGLIPQYLLYGQLGLLNNFLVFVIPSLLNVWNLIVMQNSYREIPEALVESAKIDGAGEYRILFQLVLPLSKPVLAALSLFTAVGQWNAYYDALIFTSDYELQPIQLYLYNMITRSQMTERLISQGLVANPDMVSSVSTPTLRMAMMVIVTAPILLLYPFLQKYFVKGVIVGSLKS